LNLRGQALPHDWKTLRISLHCSVPTIGDWPLLLNGDWPLLLNGDWPLLLNGDWPLLTIGDWPLLLNGCCEENGGGGIAENVAATIWPEVGTGGTSAELLNNGHSDGKMHLERERKDNDT
jgi:hypothetical protein